MHGLNWLAAIVAMIAFALPQMVTAQTIDRQIKLIVPFPPGGPSDITARAVAEGLMTALGKPVIVENKPGLASVLGMRALLSAPADGYTLLLASNSLSYGKWLYKNLPFDALRDVRAVIALTQSPNLVLVSPAFSGDSIRDLIKQGIEKPDRLNFASAGAGTIPHLGAELFMQMTGARLTHIPYKGSGDAIVGLVAGQVDVYFDILLSALPRVKSGQLKAIGVTSLQRSRYLPDVPTLDEQGVKGYELNSSFGLVTHTDAPTAIVNKLNQEINAVLKTQKFQERLAAVGGESIGGSPQDFRNMMEKESALWERVIRVSGISID